MDYIKALEEEREKIMVFERELPLILQLVTQAIEAYKRQHVGVGEEINGEGSFLEEFIPLRPCCSSSDEENNCNYENENVKVNGGINGDGDENKKKKPDWLQLAWLWSQQPEQSKGDGVNKPVAMNAKRIRGAFHPFEREKIVNMAPASLTSNDNTNGVCGNGGSREEKEKKEKEGHSLRKVRRFWPTELHRRFLNALQELGGPHVAGPEQIRELLKVDGVTNDEVKSHLQSYLSKILEGIPMNAKRIRGAFHPFEREKIVNVAPASSTSNDNTNGVCGNGGSREEKEKGGHSRRKVRSCWSMELHRRFLNALQELGRLHAVTPKQIRVLMNVDGLTNDEVKSHLQKYRLHQQKADRFPSSRGQQPTAATADRFSWRHMDPAAT